MIKRKTVETTIGKTFADKLDEIVIDISPTLSFSRREMVDKLGCANFIAAARLQKVLKRLKILTPGQLFRFDPFSLYRTRGIGDAAVFVAMCILEAFGYDVMMWWNVEGKEKQKAIRRTSKRKQEV